MGKKIGRPKAPPTEVLRVSRDVYLMVHWISDANRWSLMFTVDMLFSVDAREQYLQLMPLIKHRKAIEDENAKLTGNEPLPLPNVMVEHPDTKSPVRPESLSDEELKRFLTKQNKADKKKS